MSGPRVARTCGTMKAVNHLAACGAKEYIAVLAIWRRRKAEVALRLAHCRAQPTSLFMRTAMQIFPINAI